MVINNTAQPTTLFLLIHFFMPVLAYFILTTAIIHHFFCLSPRLKMCFFVTVFSTGYCWYCVDLCGTCYCLSHFSSSPG